MTKITLQAFFQGHVHFHDNPPSFVCKYIKRLEDFEFFTGIKTKLLQKINQHLINAGKVMADRPYFCTEIKINGGHLKDVENTHFERLW